MATLMGTQLLEEQEKQSIYVPVFAFLQVIIYVINILIAFFNISIVSDDAQSVISSNLFIANQH